MSLTDVFRKFSILIFVVLALLLSRSGFGYLLILVLIGLIVSFINKRKREAIITGVLYALVGYILSYPSGLMLKDYMPSITIPVQTSTATVVMDLLIGALIPTCVAIIVCGITAIIGSNIAKYIDGRNEENPLEERYNPGYTQEDNGESDYIYVDKNDEELLNYTPIHKAKMRKEREKTDEE